MKRLLTPLGFLVASALLTGCGATKYKQNVHAEALAGIDRALCLITPTDGNTAHGTITFVQNGGQVRVTADITGLEPNSTHAFHIHQFGNITGSQGKRTGGHYNPQGYEHGLPQSRRRHAGDLGNLTADETGHARLSLTVDNISIAGPRNPIIGRAIILHAKADDGGQPTGNAGTRIGQGVIGIGDNE